MTRFVSCNYNLNVTLITIEVGGLGSCQFLVFPDVALWFDLSLPYVPRLSVTS